MSFAPDYNTVPERIVEFREKYPEGTLRPVDPARPFELVDVAGKTFLVVVAAAYRTADDPAPGVGMAWEPVPGLTNFTRNSELQNAETSAWGRAIIAVGAADAKKGIASAEDVRNRRSEQDEPLEDPAAPGLRSSLQGAIDKLDDPAKQALKGWFQEQGLPPVRVMNAEQCSTVIDHLLDMTEGSGVDPQGDVGNPDPSPKEDS